MSKRNKIISELVLQKLNFLFKFCAIGSGRKAFIFLWLDFDLGFVLLDQRRAGIERAFAHVPMFTFHAFIKTHARVTPQNIQK